MITVAGRDFSLPLAESASLFASIRAGLLSAVERQPLDVAIYLLPVAEQGAVGYDLLVDRAAKTSLFLGRPRGGAATLRTTSYSARGNAIRLVASDGKVRAGQPRNTRSYAQSREATFPHMDPAADAAWSAIHLLYPERSREGGTVCEVEPGFEESLLIAQSRLQQWNPSISMYGVPNEAQFGYELLATEGWGRLSVTRPHHWTLRWEGDGDQETLQWETAGVEDPCNQGSLHGPVFNRRTLHRRRSNRAAASVERRLARGRRATD